MKRLVKIVQSGTTTLKGNKYMEPFFSVLIPVYNDEETIGTCIESLLKQPFLNFELLVCDDASTDHTHTVLEKYLQNDSRIKIITHKRNMKALTSRNDLIRSARAKYCIFVDADDEILPCFLTKAYQILIKNHYDIIQFSYEFCRKDNTTITLVQKNIGVFPLRNLSRKNILRNFLWGKPQIWAPWAKTYARSLLLKAMPEDHYQEIVDDFQLTVRAALFAQSYLSLGGEKVYRYKYGAGEFGKKNWSMEKFEKFCRVLSDITQETDILFQDNHLGKEYSDRIREVLIPDFFLMVREHYFRKNDLTQALRIFLNHFEHKEIINNAVFITKDTSLSEFLVVSIVFFKMFFNRWLSRLSGKKGFYEP